MDNQSMSTDSRASAELLERVRGFFAARQFLEVSTPLIDAEMIPEAHIDPFEVPGLGYLRPSPEMHLKRLLCAGSGAIFEIGRCFRAGERGNLHQPEFTMVEWYRPGDDMRAGIELLDQLMQEVAGSPPAKKTSYAEAFEQTLGWNPHTWPLERLQQVAGESIADRDELLNVLLAKQVEPTLGSGPPEILYHYPASQSALATTTFHKTGIEVAERFELYWKGVELANGYHELTDAGELRRRLVTANHQRVAGGRPALPLPEKLLAAMDNPGLPSCAGVALGFDRLLMLSVGADSIGQVMEGNNARR